MILVEKNKILQITSLTALSTNNTLKSGGNGDIIKTGWDALENAVFDKRSLD
jgi:hypothetical protein